MQVRRGPRRGAKRPGLLKIQTPVHQRLAGVFVAPGVERKLEQSVRQSHPADLFFIDGDFGQGKKDAIELVRLARPFGQFGVRERKGVKRTAEEPDSTEGS